MKVVGGTIGPWGGSLPEAIDLPHRSWNERRGWLLTLVDEEGCRGQGEATPLPAYSPDSIETCREVLQAALNRLPLSLDFSEKLAPQIGAWSAGFSSSPAAQMALETALFDLAGQRLETPVWNLLREGSPGPPVPLAALLYGLTPEDVLGEVESHHRQGVRVFKMKSLGPGLLEKDFARLAALRNSDANLGLRLDVNGRWSSGEARRNLRALTPLHLEFVEQPVSPSEMGGVLDSPVPLAADESLRDPEELDRLIARGFRGCIILKPTVLGGLTRCFDMASRAGRVGLSSVITHLFEGPLALAASSELALALDPPPLACGLAPHPALSAFPGMRRPQFEPSRLVPHRRPGLGLPFVEGA